MPSASAGPARMGMDESPNRNFERTTDSPEAARLSKRRPHWFSIYRLSKSRTRIVPHMPAKESSGESDSELLIAIAAGSRRALDELYLGYQRRLARFLSRFTQRRENIEE